MTRLLITGALGHIGAQYALHIQPRSYDEIVLLDKNLDPSVSYPYPLPMGNKYRLLKADILNDDLKSIFSGIDVVFHLAAITDATHSIETRAEIFMVNLEGTRRVAQACAVNHCKMLFLSTTSIYGTNKDFVDESSPLEDIHPQNPYAESKLIAEQYLLELAKESNFQFTILRLGTTIGTSVGMRFHTAVNKFCWQACHNEPITVWRTAFHQYRPYTHIEDVLRVLSYIVETDQFDNGIYNVVTINTTVSHVIEVIRRVLPGIQVIDVDSPVMNQYSFRASSQRIIEKGFYFTGSLEHGIEDTIRYIQSGINNI